MNLTQQPKTQNTTGGFVVSRNEIQQLKTPDFISGFAESRIGGRSENQDSYGCLTPHTDLL